MAFDSPVFKDYVAKQGDFNAPYPQADVVQAQVGLGALPIQQPQIPGIPAPGAAFQPGGGAIPEPNPAQEIAQNPFFQFYNMYKGSSKEKQNTAIARLAQDYNNPLEMGLPYDEITMGEVKKKKDTGENEPDPSAWKRFLNFVDSNPQFLLDLGAQLLAPRPAGQSQLGAIASALQGATQRLAKRRADAKASALETQKVKADIASTVADTSKVASEIAVNESQAVKNLREAYAGKQPAEKVQILDKLQNSLWNTYGTGENAVIGSKDEARLIAFDYMEGRDTERLKAFLKFAGDNAFLTGIPTAIADAQAMQDAAPKGVVAGLDAKKAAKKRAKEIEAERKKLLSDPNKLRAYLKKQAPNMPDEAIEARMQQLQKEWGGKVKSGKVVSSTKKPAASTDKPAASTDKPVKTTPQVKDVGKAYLDAPKIMKEQAAKRAAEKKRLDTAIKGLQGKSAEEIRTFRKKNWQKLTYRQKFKISALLRTAK